MSNVEADGLQQQKTSPDSTAEGQGQECEATVGIGSLKLDS